MARPLGQYWGRICIVIFFCTIGSQGCKQRSPSQVDLSSNGAIRIGEVGSMTGADATFGTSTHNGISLAFEEVNAAGGVLGRKLELITLDDQGKASEAVLATQKLMSHHQVLAVLGEVASSLSIAMAPIAQEFKTPMISPSSINSKLTQQGNYVFRVCFVDQFQSRVMADFAFKHLHARRVALLQDTKSDYSRDSAKIFSEVFRKAGGEIVVDQSYSAGDINFRSQLTAIRAAQPDLILVPGYYTEIGLIARQKQELGIKAPMLGGDGWDSPKLKEIGGAALEGSYFVSHFAQDNPSPFIQSFVQKYKSAYKGVSPDGLAALGYDSALVLVDALKRASAQTPEGVRAAIASTKDLQGVTGKITMSPDRNAVKPAMVFQILRDGQFKLSTTMNP
jgi:branched-chain amino acid transport system substrate-binding protein